MRPEKLVLILELKHVSLSQHELNPGLFRRGTQVLMLELNLPQHTNCINYCMGQATWG